MIVLVIAVNLIGWALLALGLPGHHRAWFGAAPAPGRRRLLRLSGWACLPLAWGLAVAQQGHELGSVMWAATLMLAALAWALVMAARETLSAAGGRTPGAAGARRVAKGQPRS
ncbi:DUF3325 domain-containing protein [uncultured Arenimonas sp.]|uniref:DUF3325 domain-containing protein n=1 Tax=uncultured Arenimonas sp. TaxID=546226 RepID=UPI0030D81CB1